MKRAMILLGLLVALLPSLARAECNSATFTNKNAYDSETVTVSSTAIGFTAAKYARSGMPSASAVLVVVTLANIRFWETGVAPTTTAGLTVTAGQSIQICGTRNIRNFLAIRDDAVDAELAVQFYE